MKIFKVLAKLIIESDFKTVKKKFLDQGAHSNEISEYFQLFKQIKNRNQIQDKDKKDIDFWGKKDFQEFKDFVDGLKDKKSKTEELKLRKMEGAKLVDENDDYWVYHITNFDAAKLYGSGTKWCITQADGKWWKQYSWRNNFYFYISKNKDKNDPLYKVAMTVDTKGNKTYWDAPDKQIKEPPTKVNYKFEPKSYKESEKVKAIAYQINSRIEAEEEYYSTQEAYESYEDYLEISDDYKDQLDSDLEELVEELEKLLTDENGSLDEDKLKEILSDSSDVNFRTDYYYTTNEVASVSVGTQENSLGDILGDVLDDYKELSDEDKEGVQALIDIDLDMDDIEKEYYPFGSDYNSLILTLQEDRLKEKISEIKNLRKLETMTNEQKLEKFALKTKHPEVAIKATERIKDKDTLLKLLKRKNKFIRIAAMERLSKLYTKDKDLADLSKKILDSKKVDDKLKLAALPNLSEEILKQIVTDKNTNYLVLRKAFELIKDPDFIKATGLKNSQLYEEAANAIDDPKFLHKLLNVVMGDGIDKDGKNYSDVGAINVIIDKLPKTYQEDFKKIANTVFSGHTDIEYETLFSKIKDQEFIYEFITTSGITSKGKFTNRKGKNEAIQALDSKHITKLIQNAGETIINSYKCDIIEVSDDANLKLLVEKTDDYFSISDILEKAEYSKDFVSILKKKGKEDIQNALEWLNRGTGDSEKAQKYAKVLNIKLKNE